MRAGVFKGKVNCSGTQPYSVEVTIRMGITTVVYNGVRHNFPNVEQYLCMHSDGSTDGVKTNDVDVTLDFIKATPTHAPTPAPKPSPGPPSTPSPPGGPGPSGPSKGGWAAIIIGVLALVAFVGAVGYRYRTASRAGYQEV